MGEGWSRPLVDYRATRGISLSDRRAADQRSALKQVAVEVGFADTASLSKAFRKRLGASPRAWLAASATQAR
ncbi:hypothetical protein C7E18_22050 [Stenotrophomonas maltophilia]|nr:hypothetical protein C7E18_22050 [Stenotrophomonas maltophilia]